MLGVCVVVCVVWVCVSGVDVRRATLIVILAGRSLRRIAGRRGTRRPNLGDYDTITSLRRPSARYVIARAAL